MYKLIRYIYYLLLLTFILPSGSILGFPVKTLLSLLLLLLFFFDGIYFEFDKKTKTCIFIFIFLGLWSVISMFNGYGTYLSFIKSYFSLLFTVWISYELPKYHLTRNSDTSKVLGFVSICIILIKIIVSFGLSLNIFNIDTVSSIYKNYFNTDLTTMYLPIGRFTFYRIMVSNDSIPFIWFGFALLTKMKKSEKWILTFLMAIYTFIIYSRFTMMEYALIIACFVFIYLKNNKGYIKRHRIHFIVLLALLVAGAIVVCTKTNIVESIMLRFTSKSSSVSDKIREIQYGHLIEGIKSGWLLGHGTGSYLKDYLRSTTTLYSYEMEYLSFVYQFGIIGFLLIILPTIKMFFSLCFARIKDTDVILMLLVLFAVWLIKPFFNPGFLSSNSGIIVASMYVMALNTQRIRKKKSKKKDTKKEAAIPAVTLEAIA